MGHHLRGIVALGLFLAIQAQADTLMAKVIMVADGDTITVLDDTKHLAQD